MKKIMTLAYALLAMFGASLLFWIIPNNTEDSGFGLSPALLPNALAVLILATSLILLFQTLRSEDDRPSNVTWTGLLRLGAFSAIIFGAFPLMGAIGFVPGAAATMVLLQLMCGQRSVPWLIGVTAAMTAAAYAMLVYVVQVPLP